MYRESRFISLLLVASMAITCCLTGYKKKDMSLKLNEPRNMRGVIGYKRFLGDLSEKYLKVAQTTGIRSLASREVVEKLKEKLQHITTNDLYVVDSLTHSIPYLTPGTAALLDTVGYNFLDLLTAKGPNPNKITVTSILHTKGDVKRLCRRNTNTSESSAYFYGIIFDVSWKCFQKIEDKNRRLLQGVSSDILKLVLSEVLRDLKKADKYYVKYELKRGCFHIATRI